MRRLWISFHLLLVSVVSFAAPQKNCFSEHLREAIDVNQRNFSLYSRVTEGRSDRILRRLIQAETFLLLPARAYDRVAMKYNAKGIPVFCSEFLPMALAKGFDPSLRVSPARPYEAYSWQKHRKDLLNAVEKKNISLIRTISEVMLKELGQAPDYHCMLRHVIESIHRFALHLPLHVEQSTKYNLKSPQNLSLSVIRHHLRIFKAASELDEWSSSLQEEGIPILCVDLPH